MPEPARNPVQPQQSISQLLFRCIRDPRSRFSATAALCVLLFASAPCGHSQTPGIAEKPYRGWTSFSQQTISSNFLTQANISAQSDALLASGLQTHGFDFINMDSGWQGSFDANGRPIPNSTTFPDIAALVAHIHSNGQKAGIYWIPGVEYPAVVANSPILGTPYHIQDILVVPYTAGNAFGGPGTSPYHYKIDFTKRGAQEYMNSVVNLFACWGFDAIKLDGVTPGSYSDNLSIDNRADVAAWAKAIAQSGRPMWFTISWALDQGYLSTWQQYANARRIDGDIDCEGNCSTITNWAMANAPMYLGGDLTTLDNFGKQILSNDEVLAVNQSGHPATEALAGDTPVWISDLGRGSYYVALFNLNAFPSRVVVPWSSLGFANAARVRDLWNHIELGRYDRGFSTTLLGHGVRLLKVEGEGEIRTPESQSYEAESATLNGSAVIAACPACSGGEKVGGLALGLNNNVTFNNVVVRRDGVYQMQIDSMTQGPRSLIYSVNGGPLRTLNVGGGSFFLPSSTTVSVGLHAGVNSIEFGSPTSYPPDMDRIVVSGDGRGAPPFPKSTTYEAENATLAGTVTPPYCEYCSGGGEAGNIGGGSGNTVTFTNVNVDTPGTYQMEVDYLTAAPRSFFISVNGGAATELDLNGSSWSLPTSTVIPVQLQAGANTIQFGNSTGYAPALDRIAIAPVVESSTLTGTISGKTGSNGLRIWTVSLNNSGPGSALGTQINIFSVTQTSGVGSCHPKTLLPLPIELKSIPPGGHAEVDVPIDFSGSTPSAGFSVSLVFSADNGAEVGNFAGSGETR